MNLKIDILTKKVITKLEFFFLFLYFTINFRKSKNSFKDSG